MNNLFIYHTGFYSFVIGQASGRHQVGNVQKKKKRKTFGGQVAKLKRQTISSRDKNVFFFYGKQAIWICDKFCKYVATFRL